MNNIDLRLQLDPLLLEDAQRTAQEEGIALSQLLNVAIAEKLAAMKSEAFFRARARRANVDEALNILDSLGKGNPPIEGDELSQSKSA